MVNLVVEVVISTQKLANVQCIVYQHAGNENVCTFELKPRTGHTYRHQNINVSVFSFAHPHGIKRLCKPQRGHDFDDKLDHFASHDDVVYVIKPFSHSPAQAKRCRVRQHERCPSSSVITSVL